MFCEIEREPDLEKKMYSQFAHDEKGKENDISLLLLNIDDNTTLQRTSKFEISRDLFESKRDILSLSDYMEI